MAIQALKNEIRKLANKRSKETQEHIAYVIKYSDEVWNNTINDKFKFIKRLDNECPDEYKLRRVINMLAEEKKPLMNSLPYISSIISNKYNNYEKQKEVERKIYGTLPPIRDYEKD